MLLARKNAGRELKKASKEALSCYKNPREMAANLGIGGTTFRAFKNFCKPLRPSEIYRDWVNTKGYQLVMQETLTSRKDFLFLHGQLVKSFKNYCKKLGCRELSISEANKVVDLFTKIL
ncbi:MAG: hypothetical protein KJ002_01870, partial [Candidatus Dadabacteria bacterium]|nr:hypothetical protein [Candidatus Dadabacteria bacterium]